MADTNFIFTPDDKKEFVTWLKDEFDATFIVDDNKPAITEYRSLAKLSDILEAQLPPLIFVTSKNWSSLPLYKRSVINKHEGKIHYVMQKYGGPSFTLMTGNWLERDGKLAISSGFFGDYPFYYVRPDSSDTVDRPAHMKDAYRAAQSKIKKICSNHRTIFKDNGRPGPWISKHASVLVESGAATIANSELRLK